MRHPFDGINRAETGSPARGPASEGEPAEFQFRPTRRSVLHKFLGLCTAAIGWGAGHRAVADSGRRDIPEQVSDRHRLYFVVPKDVKAFDVKRRGELGVGGDFLNGWRGNEKFEKTQGFLAWCTPIEAEKLSRESDVAGAHEVKSGDVQVRGLPQRGHATLMIPLYPNRWRLKPEEGSYLEAAELAKQWTKDFAAAGDVKVKAMKHMPLVIVTFGSGKVREEVVQSLRSHPQVFQLQWDGMATTMALGEEGNRPPGITTKAIGEEGGGRPRPTTLAVGEEGGGRPRPSTRALGEEGGGRPRPPHATTLAIGEEGGGLPR